MGETVVDIGPLNSLYFLVLYLIGARLNVIIVRKLLELNVIEILGSFAFMNASIVNHFILI